jgi:nucleoid-associated protein YgaU
MKRSLLMMALVGFILGLGACGSAPKTDDDGVNKARAEAKLAELIRKQDEIKAQHGQDLDSNVYFQRSIELRKLSQEALVAGDYEAAYNYAHEGIIELDKFRSNEAILLAETRARDARQRGLNSKNPDKFAEILSLIETAKTKFRLQDYKGSLEESTRALELLDLLFGGDSSVDRYTVVRGDSLWKIAGRNEIYNDNFAWPRIYMANKSRLRDPNNPDLIFPDQVFAIPR